MFRVGVTGGIGSGKTLICKIFEILGVPVYYADLQAKKILVSEPDVITKLTECFGKVILKQGKPDREKIASIVFNSPDALNRLNSVIHPFVRKDFNVWTSNKKGYSYVIEEAAILFESGAFRLLDFTITISAPQDLRIKRVMERDNTDRKSIMARIANQMNEEERISLADAVIVNDNKLLVIPQVVELHNRLISLAEKKRKKS
ncbi:MAG: hypothetical protein AMS27_07460 [Bacteroides sp. SM23_62_1]|nr:MAG: hypothetical protein AMS27_07460 [Bacteroides sp. SM23_62_1]